MAASWGFQIVRCDAEHHALYTSLCSAHAYSSTIIITSIPDAGGLETQRLGAVDAVGMPPGMLTAPSQGASRRPVAQPQ
jgi:hypothetical protein